MEAPTTEELLDDAEARTGLARGQLGLPRFGGVNSAQTGGRPVRRTQENLIFATRAAIYRS